MEVGEYIKEIHGCIHIISEIIERQNGFKTIITKDNVIVPFENIVKHSKNIKDLLEVGDILKINNKKYEVVFDEIIEKLGLLIPNEKKLAIRHCTMEYVFSKNGIEEFKNIEILTKEQYESNCYRLEELKKNKY